MTLPIDAILSLQDRLVEAVNNSEDFWVEAKEIDSGIGIRLAVSDKRTGLWHTVIVEVDEQTGEID